MPVKNYYAELNIAPDSDQRAIKQAYRALVRRCNPDANLGDHTAVERFRALTEAYRILSNPRRRHRYDELLQQPQQCYHAHEEQKPDWQQWQHVLGVHRSVQVSYATNTVNAVFAAATEKHVLSGDHAQAPKIFGSHDIVYDHE
jgi:curved DNA-binding protein CbpA